MHTMNPGCDFRLNQPTTINAHSTVIDPKALMEHPSREQVSESIAESNLSEVNISTQWELTIGLCESQKQVFYINNENDAEALLAQLKVISDQVIEFQDKYLLEKKQTNLLGKGSFGQVY